MRRETLLDRLTRLTLELRYDAAAALAQVDWLRTQCATAFPDDPPDAAWIGRGGTPRE